MDVDVLPPRPAVNIPKTLTAQLLTPVQRFGLCGSGRYTANLGFVYVPEGNEEPTGVRNHIIKNDRIQRDVVHNHKV